MSRIKANSEHQQQEKRYVPNEQLLGALQAMEQEVSEQSQDYKSQLEAIFQQRYTRRGTKDEAND